MVAWRIALGLVLVAGAIGTTTGAGAGGAVVRTLEGHGGTVRPAFSPDGKVLATASDDRTIKLWDAATGKPLRSLVGHDSGVWRVTFSPDGRTLASVGADRRVILWHAESGEKKRALEGHAGAVRAAAFSPDGVTLATGGDDETVRLWDMASGEVKWTLPIRRRGELPEVVWSLAFAPDGATLAAGSGNGVGGDGHVRLVEAKTGELRSTVPGPHGEQVWAVAYSPDGRVLAAGTTGGNVTLRDPRTLEVTREWHCGGSLRSLAFSPDGKSLAAAVDREVKLWDASTGGLLRTLAGHGNWVMHVAYSPDGRHIASGSSDRTVRLWALP